MVFSAEKCRNRKPLDEIQFDGLSFSFSGVHTGGFSTVSKTVFVLVLVFVGLFRGLLKSVQSNSIMATDGLTKIVFGS